MCSDVRLSEDAYFTARVHWARAPPPLLPTVTYAGVADGVGSWRALGVDPRNFSQRLMTCCTQVENAKVANERKTEKQREREKERESERERARE